jgi:hypothetical protein
MSRVDSQKLWQITGGNGPESPFDNWSQERADASEGMELAIEASDKIASL